MTSMANPAQVRRTPKPVKPWMVKTRRVLEILSTGGMVWLTEVAEKKSDRR